VGTQIARFRLSTAVFIDLKKCENEVKKKETSHGQDNFPDGVSPSFPLSQVTAKAEKDHIMKILRSTDGNKSRAAEILGISRKTLWEKLKVYNIEL